jgi:tripeptide aminopeptidase
MNKQQIPLDGDAAVEHLMRFLSVEGVTGEEKAIGETVIDALVKVGVPRSAIRFDTAHERIKLPTQTGNLIAELPGTRDGARMVFSTHLDTVLLCAGAKPKREGGRIHSDGTTALGGDNRTGCAVLVSLAESIIKHKLPHPPITLLFTVREESGLHGARELDPKDLKGATMCFNFDSRLPNELIIGAVGQENWDVMIKGKAAHAGIAPEKGISATMVAAVGLVEVQRGGWFGKVVKPEGNGTSNVGIFEGKPGKAAGDATNVVTDYVHLRGEARGTKMEFVAQITAAYGAAFEKAKGEVKDSSGGTAEVKFQNSPSYPPFKLTEECEAVQRGKRAVEALGMKPTTVFSNGGLDANWLSGHGVPTVTFGAGQYEIHTVNEYVEISEFLDGCRVAIAVATME